MRKSIFIFVIIAVFKFHTSQAQQLAPQAITLEIGGLGLSYSPNYEHRLGNHFVARASFSFLHIKEKQTGKSNELLSFPVSLSYLKGIGAGSHFAEFGIGTMNLLSTGNLVEYQGITDFFLNPGLILGYRYLPSESPWSLKASFTPFLGTESLTQPGEKAFSPFGGRLQPWGGIGIGYSF
jgi:hypothetical protein